MLPVLSEVLSFLASPAAPPYSLIFSTPSVPRNSMSSRSSLRVIPYREPAAILSARAAPSSTWQHSSPHEKRNATIPS